MNDNTKLTKLASSSEVSMTSKEIAELVGSRHDDVKRSIERLVNQELISQPPTADGIRAANGVVEKLYVFSGEQGKRDSLVLVARLSPTFTAALVDRWLELEQQVPLVHNHLTPALHAAALAPAMMKAYEAFGFVGNQTVLAANRAVAHVTDIDLLAISGNSALVAPDNEPLVTPSDIAKKLGISVRAVNPILIEAGLQVKERDHHNNAFYTLTEEGQNYGTYLDIGKRHGNGVPIRQLKWKASVISLVEDILSN